MKKSFCFCLLAMCALAAIRPSLAEIYLRPNFQTGTSEQVETPPEQAETPSSPVYVPRPAMQGSANSLLPPAAPAWNPPQDLVSEKPPCTEQDKQDLMGLIKRQHNMIDDLKHASKSDRHPEKPLKDFYENREIMQRLTGLYLRCNEFYLKQIGFDPSQYSGLPAQGAGRTSNRRK